MEKNVKTMGKDNYSLVHILKCAVRCSAVPTSVVLRHIGKVIVLHLYCSLFVEIQNSWLWLESCLPFLYESIFQDVCVGNIVYQFFVE